MDVHPSPHPQTEARWRGTRWGIGVRLTHGHRTIRCDGESFDVVDATWTDDGGRSRARTWIVGESRESVERFATQLAVVTAEVRDGMDVDRVEPDPRPVFGTGREEGGE